MKNLYSPDYRKKRNIISTIEVELLELTVIEGICGAWVPMYFKYGLKGFKLYYNSDKITYFSWSLSPSEMLLDRGMSVKMFMNTSTSRKTFCILWGTPLIETMCPIWSSYSLNSNLYLNSRKTSDEKGC